jgi:CRISPR-associated protein Cst2
MVGEDGRKLPEMPAVSGRMMKHWHLAHMLRAEQDRDAPKLCPECKKWEPERKPQDESAGLKACVICDAHGFLCTDKPGFKATVHLADGALTLHTEATDDTPPRTLRVAPCEHDSTQPQEQMCPTCALRKLNDKKATVTGEIELGDEESTITVTYATWGTGKAKQQRGQNPKGLSLRRSSCVNFSWLLPVLSADQVAKQVLHTRVASTGGTSEEETSQMIFNKSYASGVYAFVCSVDLGRIGKPLCGDAADVTEINRRRKLAVQAILPICIGAFGASQSHALPHARCLGLLGALSATDKPIPNLVSPIYSKGFEESVALLKSVPGAQYWGYAVEGEKGFGEGFGDNNKKNTLQEVFDEILTKVNGGVACTPSSSA